MSSNEYVENKKVKKILIIINSFNKFNEISKILKVKNYDSYFSESLISFEKEIKNHSFDLIILDIDLYVKSKINLIKNIRCKIEENIPLLVISSLDNECNHCGYIKNGASDIIKRPYVSEELTFKTGMLIDYEEKKSLLKNSQNLLKQYKNTYNVSSIISKTDPNGIIIYANENFVKTSGFARSEIIGKSHNIVRHEDMSKSTFKDMWDTIKIKKQPWFGKIKNRKKDGGYYWINVVINPILDVKGNPIEFMSIQSDITKIDESKEHFKNKYDTTSNKFDKIMSLSKTYEKAVDKSNIIIRYNSSKIITYVNNLFCNISGYTKKELIGQSYLILIDSEKVSKSFTKILKSLNKNNIWKGTIKNIFKDGTINYSISTIIAIKDDKGKLYEYMEIRQDITEVLNLHKELEDTQREIIYKMGEIGERRSKETGHHVKRVAEYSKLLALKAGFSYKDAELIKLASPMHDIGKVGIEDSILNKPGRLTDDEFDTMKKHTTIGYEMLRNSTRPALKASSIIAHEHHEKYNGTGYPNQKKGDAIHIYGRITAICDVFDALGSDRPYKKAWSLVNIIEFFNKEKGEHFDPNLTELFLNNINEFIDIKNKFNN
ncbi:MAG: PAS domain S-box protein [Arcobacter sp.]|nr:PAS domain S-box protein [Arcobacter sp.]